MKTFAPTQAAAWVSCSPFSARPQALENCRKRCASLLSKTCARWRVAEPSGWPAAACAPATRTIRMPSRCAAPRLAAGGTTSTKRRLTMLKPISASAWIPSLAMGKSKEAVSGSRFLCTLQQFKGIMAEVVARHLLAELIFRQDALVKALAYQLKEKPFLIAVRMADVFAKEPMRAKDPVTQTHQRTQKGNRVGSFCGRDRKSTRLNSS